MPCCELCQASFPAEIGLTHHLRQSLVCRATSFNERVTIAEALRQSLDGYPTDSDSSPPPSRSPTPTCSTTPPPLDEEPPNQTPPSTPPPNIPEAAPSPSSTSRHFIVEYPGAGEVIKDDKDFMARFDDDCMAAIDELLSLPIIQSLKLSFSTAKAMHSWVELLPPGPQWQHRPLPLHPNYPTKRKTTLYHRDPVECIEYLMQNPLLSDHISYTPLQVYRSANKLMRIYSHWLTGTHAWDLQDALPDNGTLLGVILSSDKTQVSAMTSGRSAYPLLLSLANLDFDFRNKGTNNAFLLIALLPVPKFTERNKDLHGVLGARLTHLAFDVVLEPLKVTAQVGIMLSDAFGRQRYCFTPLASDIVDLPEAMLMSCVCGQTSPVTLATQKQFGDNKRYPLRTRQYTIKQLKRVARTADPWDLDAYVPRAKFARLSGVHQPFWRNWALSDPSKFLTPEPLHHWWKFSFDHDLKWCIRGVGSFEIDYRFSILHHHSNVRHFTEGVSKLKQVTGHEHRNMQRYIVTVIAGAVTPSFLIAIRSLVDFRYRAQAPELDDGDLLKLQQSLNGFHTNKKAIIDAGARVGKKKVIDNWYIPKLEMLQSVIPSIRTSGVPRQFSAQVTEHAHIKLIKEPSRASNNQGHEPQICRNLDRHEKCRGFDLTTSMRTAKIVLGQAGDGTRPVGESVRNEDGGEEDDSDEDDEDGHGVKEVRTSAALRDALSNTKPTRKPRDKDHFVTAKKLSQDSTLTLPHRTLSTEFTAIHLKGKPCYSSLSIDRAATLFDIPDLRQALSHYIHRASNQQNTPFSVGGVRSRSAQPLPFNLRVWTRCRVQNKSIHYPHPILPASTVHAAPPTGPWTKGRHEPVILNVDSSKQWPHSGLNGHCVVQLVLIMQAVPLDGAALPPCFNSTITYVRRLDIVPQVDPSDATRRGPYPEPTTSLFVLSRAKRSDSTPMGDVVPLHQVRCPLDLVPKFNQAAASLRLTRETSLACYSEFYLNKYFTDELFFALS
ncbi:hypothetical protein BDN72DRAFT_895699 [Pluteus cervinus]|uniref:Uncharacterized protein n=1 Tax=Pluteus cervinus TaxID=181527 RepID=A0ACD3B116_9AGAR|nr:hypothetical protein BDN72DRAFT_895699 [Pluteus cervinus]